MKRREFLTEFLGALGAESIEWQEETDGFVSGRVIYDKNDPEETQEFCWHKGENEVPNENVLNLAKLIKRHKLLSIDKIIVKREELRSLYNSCFSSNLSTEDFSETIEQLEEIEVPMVDEGKETDAYFIHE